MTTPPTNVEYCSPYHENGSVHFTLVVFVEGSSSHLNQDYHKPLSVALMNQPV